MGRRRPRTVAFHGKGMLDGKKIALLAGSGMESCIAEMVEIIRAMKNVNARVRIVGGAEMSPGPLGHQLRIDTTVDALKPTDMDAYVICHDCTGEDDERHEKCYAFLRQAHEAGVLIAAIGNGLQALVRAGIIDDEAARRLQEGRNILSVQEAGLIIAPRATGVVDFIQGIIAVLSRLER